MIARKKIPSIIYSIFVIVVFLFYFFNTTNAETLHLLDKSIYTENKKSSVTIHPRFTNYTTSLILYVSNGDIPETWTYEPETLGFGDFLFSDYFYFGSPASKYVLVEYVNDGQTFSCYGMPQDDCVANPHFISQSRFQISDDLIIDPIISVITAPLNDTATSTVTTVDIDGMTIVTSVLIPSILETPTASSTPVATTTPIVKTIPPDIVPEETIATSSLSTDTNTNGTTTETF